MIFLISLVGAVGYFLLLLLLFHIYRKPKARMYIRMHKMISEAEAERKAEAEKRRAEEEAAEEEEKERERKPVSEYSLLPRMYLLLSEKLQKFFARMAPRTLAASLEDRILRSGRRGRWTLQKFLVYQAFSMLMCFLATLLFVMNGGLHFVQQVAFLCLAVIAGALIPWFMLNSAVRRYRQNLRRQMPDFLDLLCVSVQAGLSFDGALSKINLRMKGELVDELRHMQNDVRLGMTRQHALTTMANRCDIEEIYLFAASVVQAERLGTSMAKTIKQQADNMRDRHRQYIKAQALKAPVKMVFPMVLFIFPAIFVVVLLPALLSLAQNLGR